MADAKAKAAKPAPTAKKQAPATKPLATKTAKSAKAAAKAPVQKTVQGSRPIRIGLIGAGWITTTHYDSFKALGNCAVLAQADPNPDKLKWFGAERPVRDTYKSHHELLKRKDIDVVTVAVPNWLHAPLAKDALLAGKHIIVEKPLCLRVSEAEELMDIAQRKGLVIGYAEELCYIPKFERMKQIADSGGIGSVYMVKQCEKHGGPYSPWFFSPKEAGGGILMDMGCHAIEFCRWFMGKKPVRAVTAHCGRYVHTSTPVEDHVILTMEFMDGTLGQIESSWALQGGMTSVAEAYGTSGVVYADLLQGNGLSAFSYEGYAPMPENKAQMGGPDSRGWTKPDYEWLHNNGYPQEMKDFLDCIRHGGVPRESAADGLAVLEIMLAGYHSAGTGRRVELPFRPDIESPVDLWIHPRHDLGK